MKCEFCGQELLEDAVYCNYCGKKVEKKQQFVKSNKSTNKNKSQKHNRLFWIVCVVITLICCIINNNIIERRISRNSKNTISDTNYNEVNEEIEKYIIAQKETLPITISDGMTMIDVELEGKMLVITTELEGVLPSDCTQQTADDAKEEILSSGVFNDDLRLLFRKLGYGIIYSYVNEYNEPLYKIHIYPHEL